MASTDIVNGARRIVIYGVTGSGKSTLAARLSEITGLRWHSVDDLTWLPGWVEVPVDRQRELIRSICHEPEWILDTAYGKWLDEPLGRAELVVALDYPRWFSLQRLVRRTLARLIDGRLICNGNRVWHFKSFRRKRQRIRQWLTDPSAPPVHRLTSARRTEQWLRAASNS